MDHPFEHPGADTGIGNAGAAALAEGVKASATLKKLELGSASLLLLLLAMGAAVRPLNDMCGRLGGGPGNEFGTKGVKELAGGVKGSRTLTTLIYWS